MDAPPTFSIVTPVHNEVESLRALHDVLCDVMTALGEPFEVLMVDDGSSDGSYAVMEELALTDPRFRAVGLSRNFGHQVALSAGLDLAAGHAVITMDADLQHPPNVIPELVERWREGYDVVYGVMRSRASETKFKSRSSNLFYRLFGRLVDIPIESNAGDFRLLDRAVVDVLRDMPERNRYLRGMVAWTGFRQVGVPYDCAPRHAGQTSYSLTRMLRLAVDAVISFSVLPLRLVLSLGLIASALSAAVGISSLLARIVGFYTAPGWTTVIVVTTFLGGMQLCVLGLMGEYIGRIYDEVKRRPMYLVSRTAGTARSVRRPPSGQETQIPGPTADEFSS